MQPKSKASVLQFEGLEVVVHRKPRRRTMTIQMGPEEPIKILTAMRVSDQDVLKFLNMKSKWIHKNIQEFEKRPKIVKRQALRGEEWMYLGKPVVVSDAITLLKKPFVVFSEGLVTVYWPENLWATRDQSRHLAFAWIQAAQKKEAERIFKERIQFYGEQMHVMPKRVRLMRAETRWGSCSSKQNLNLNWKLLGAPMEVLDSIVVHELAHLKHMNHSKVFWNFVEQFAPQHSEADQWLKDNQHLL